MSFDQPHIPDTDQPRGKTSTKDGRGSELDPQRISEIRAQRAAKVVDLLRAVAPEVLARYPVDVAYLYGSMARGTPLPDSDVDVALLLNTSPEPYPRLLLELEIQATLEDASGLSEIDVRSLNEAPLSFQGSVLGESILLFCANQARRVAFEVATRKQYFDYQPLADRLRQRMLAHIREKGLRYGQTRNR
jgi:predicted nucleotidyltransferase